MTITTRFAAGDTDYVEKLNDMVAQTNAENASTRTAVDGQVVVASGHASAASASAAQAAASALGAASVVSQDLSAVDRLVISSTTLVDVCLYDTSRDSDGGAWRKRCQHTSWYQEPISGNWLGAAASEAAARALPGAVTGSYYYDTTAAIFRSLNAGSGVTEVFRGKAREFPSIALITVSSARVVIWDATDATLPMWMVFTAANGNMVYGGSGALSSVAALHGVVVVGHAYYDLWVIDFLRDRGWTMGDSTTAVKTRDYVGNVARRNALAGYGASYGQWLAARAVYDVAMTVLPNAPIDAATGLRVPTIAAATPGGLSIVKPGGTVDSNGNSCNFVLFVSATRMLFGGLTWWLGYIDGWQDSAVRDGYFASRGGAPAPSNLPYLSAGAVNGAALARGAWGSSAGVTLIKEDHGAPGNSMVAYASTSHQSGWLPGSVSGAWLADTTVETIIGNELAVTGDFASDANWTKGAGWAIGAGKATKTAGSASDIEQDVALTVGVAYTVMFTVSGRTAGTVTARLGGAAGSAVSANGVIAQTIVAGDGGAPRLEFVADAAFDGALDDVSLRRAVNNRYLTTAGLRVFGSVAKTLVAPGAQLVGYAGWSVENYLEQPYSAAHDYGTGAFSVLFWLNEAANVGGECVAERDSAVTAQRWTVEVNAAGNLLFTCDDNTTTRTATSALAIDDGAWHLYMCQYDGAGGVRIYRDGLPAAFATATGAALLTLNNAAAVLRAGLAVAGGAPLASGKLALLRTTASLVSLDQFAHIWDSERVLFVDGAQCTLAGTSDAVTALAYDDMTDLLHVGTSWGRSAFRGLARVASEATPVGALKALAAGAGILAQAGASGCRIYIPAQLLREELNREAEQAAAFGSALVAHDFDGVTSQVAFRLPIGWRPRFVYSAGQLKREGATKDYTTTWDGFCWTVTFAVAPGNGVWVSVLCERSGR